MRKDRIQQARATVPEVLELVLKPLLRKTHFFSTAVPDHHAAADAGPAAQVLGTRRRRCK